MLVSKKLLALLKVIFRASKLWKTVSFDIFQKFAISLFLLKYKFGTNNWWKNIFEVFMHSKKKPSLKQISRKPLTK